MTESLLRMVALAEAHPRSPRALVSWLETSLPTPFARRCTGTSVRLCVPTDRCRTVSLYERHCPYPRGPWLRVYRAEVNQGAARNFRAVFECARGTYFSWVAHDDELRQGFLRRCVEIFDQAPPSLVLVAPLEVIGADGTRLDLTASVEILATRRPRAYQRCADVVRTVQWASAQYGLYRAEDAIE